MKKIVVTTYVILVTLFCLYLISELKQTNFELEEKETQILEYSVIIDSLMDEQHYFLEYLKIQKP